MTAGTPGFNWTEENVDRLKAMWAGGLSAAQCAAAFPGHPSRSAIIGKVHRLGLSGRVTQTRAAYGTGAPRLPRAKTPAWPKLPRAPKPPAFPRVRFVDAPEEYITPITQRCTLLDLSDAKCRWPIGDPTSKDFFFCGGKPIGGDHRYGFIPYCAYHARIAYRPPESGRRGYVRNGVSRYGVRQATTNVLSAG